MRLSLGLSTDSVSAQKVGSAFSGLLDEFTGAAAAYSVRQLKASATNSMRVRKEVSSVASETDIGFDSSGNLDTTTLLSFASGADGGNVSVKIWYDQTGNDKNAANSTPSEQPLIVSAGSLITENGKAAIKFDGNWLTTTYILPSTFSTFSVAKSNLANPYESLMGSDNTFNDWIWHLFRNDKFMLRPNSGSYYQGSVLSAQQYLIDVIYNGDLNAYIDGISYISQSSVSLPSPVGNLQIGTVNTNPTYTLDGKIQEIVLFDSDQSLKRTSIEANINSYF